MDNDALVKASLDCGADKAVLIAPSKLVSSNSFRKYCEDNVCGSYGRCWSCPPDIGDIEVLRADLKKYGYVMVYQAISEVKDYSDMEEVNAAMEKLVGISQKLQSFLWKTLSEPFLHLAGACHLCSECTKITNEPCRYPEKMLPSLSAYGIDVCKTCEGTLLEYRNGENTVTCFGMVLFNQ